MFDTALPTWRMAPGRASLHRGFMNEFTKPGVVLHVEDDQEQRESLAAVLRLAGFRPHGADCASAAIQVAQQLREELDVLIVDYHLGDQDTGTDVAESVARVLGRSVPTVILTGDPA